MRRARIFGAQPAEAPEISPKNRCLPTTAGKGTVAIKRRPEDAQSTIVPERGTGPVLVEVPLTYRLQNGFPSSEQPEWKQHGSRL
jgi:hypothetical protein